MLWVLAIYGGFHTTPTDLEGVHSSSRYCSITILSSFLVSCLLMMMQYLVMLAACGVPLLFMELAVGQYTRLDHLPLA